MTSIGRGGDRSGTIAGTRSLTQPLTQALTKTELAYQQIRHEILVGELGPETIIDQELLAERLGLSTTPVREALRLLESENLVISRRHKNTMVTPLDYGLLEETYAVRLELDPFAAATAAAQASEEEREEIRRLGRMSEEGTAPIEMLHTNRELHRAIYTASGNSVLIHILEGLWDRSDRFRMVTLNNSAHVRIADDEHADIVDAVVGGDGEKAARRMREHVQDSLDRIRREFRDPN
jgi:DNA-binding GntR family transcriptional regulator